MTIDVLNTLTIAITACHACGVQFGMPKSLLAARRADGKGFWCPNGHSLAFRETETDRLRKELERTKRRAESLDAMATSALDQLASERKALSATRGQLTKTRKRIANGVCPCCHRSFVKLAAHMQTKHPDYAETPAL
jgi:hypothetical protein